MDSNIFSIGGHSLQNRLEKAKAAFTTRRVDFNRCRSLRGDMVPRSGDLVLASVMELGQQTHLQLPSGRRARLFPGDEIVVAYGNRYAPDQFEGVVPKNLAPCHLVASGGIAARFRSKHLKMKNPTIIEPIGLIADRDGQPLNLTDFALPPLHRHGRIPLTLAVVGTSMNAGKTTTAASLVQGLSASGLRVGAAKITGTGAGGDFWLYADSGASPVFDFVDAGFASTYLIEPEKIEDISGLLLDHLLCSGVDVAVLEIADGLYHEETARLLHSSKLRAQVDGLLFAGGDSMGVMAGVQWLQREISIPLLALSGAFTMSPLAMEEVSARLETPILTSRELASTRMIHTLFQWFPDRDFYSGMISESYPMAAGQDMACAQVCH